MERREILRIAAAAVACSGMAFWAGRITRLSGGRYVQFGTSLTSGSGTKLGGMIPMMVADKLGMLGINAGCPGSCAGDHKAPAMNPVSLYALSNAVVSGDWSAQAAKTGEPLRDMAISNLMTTNFHNVTHVCLEYGPNDFRYDRPIGSDSDICKETFKGALNHAIRVLLRAYPTIRVFLMTPWWMPTLDGRDSDEHPNEVGAFLREYVEAMRRVAEINHIPCLDLWRTSGVNKFNVQDFTTGDGTHLSDHGAVRRADMIANFMRTVF